MIMGATKEELRNFGFLLKLSFQQHQPVQSTEIIPQVVKYAEKARREGLLSLEREIPNVTDPFMQQGLQLVADGTDPEIVKGILETEITKQEERHAAGPALMEAGAGYAPTVGIIGAVLGLIHVMEHLSEGIEKVGPGIAVAFVATIYGLVMANMVLLPIASKLKKISQHEIHVKEMILEGILSIQAGDNPRIIEEKLKAFCSKSERRLIEEARTK